MASTSTSNVIPGKGELITLPSGTRFYYVEEDHSYWRCKPDDDRGRRLTGVTTAIKPIDFEPDNLMRWAAKLNTVGVARLVQEALELDDPDAIATQLHWLDPENPEGIWKALTDQKMTYDDIREAKAVIGTNIHEIVLRALANGEPTPKLSELTEVEKGYATAVIDFWLDHNPKPIAVEQFVCDPDELGVAGRFDLMAQLQPCKDAACPCQMEGNAGLVDAKTGKWISEKDHVQVALYNRLAERSGFSRAAWEAILQVRPDGTYTLWKGEASEQDALDAVGLYRARGRIRNAAGKARKARG